MVYTQYPKIVNTVSFAVTTAATALSASVDLRDVVLVALLAPTSLNGTVLTFQGSDDNSTFKNIYDDAGTEYSITKSDGARMIVPAADLIGGCYIKVRCGTAASASAQTTERTITGVVRPI